MNCPSPETWELLSMDLLEKQEADAVLRHAETCDACRAAYAASRRTHTHLLRTLEVFDRQHDRRRRELMASLPPTVPDTDETSGIEGGGRLGGIVMSMKKRKGLWATTALLPAACIVFAFVAFFGSSPSIAFSAVLEKVREAKTMVCDVIMDYHIEADTLPEGTVVEGDGMPESATHIATRGTLSMYSDGQTRAWLQETTDPPRSELTLPDRMYITEGTKLTVVELTGDPDVPGYLEPPETTLQRMLDLTEEPQRELGTKLIEDREAVGFEVAADKLGLGHAGEGSSESVVRIWVDVETQLPLRVEYDVVQRGGPVQITMNGVWDHIRWNVPLDPAQFEPPEITETTEIQDMAMPPATEDALTAGLRAYADQSAEVTEMLEALEAKAKEEPDKRPVVEKMRTWLEVDSAYPKHLDPQTLMLALSARQGALTARRLSEYRREHGADAAVTDEQKAAWTREHERIAGVIGAAGLFYRKLLMEGREPEYFGATVSPGDADAVLVRWRQDDGSYRVIYGDLHAETLPDQD